MVRQLSRVIVVPVVGAALLAGCGGQSASTGIKEAAATVGGSTHTLPAVCQQKGVVTAKDWNQGPKRLPNPANLAALHGKRIAFIGFGQNNVWSQWVFKDVQCEAQTWGADATFIGPPKFDPQAQFQLASDLATSKNYDALVIVPDDSTSIAPALKQDIAAGIPVVSMLQPAGPNVLSMKNQIPGLAGNVIEDLTVNAQTMADGVIDACAGQNPCNVMVLWGARTLAFDKVKPAIFSARLSGHPNINIVCQADGGYDQAVGQSAAANCLQAHPNVNVIASQADQETRGAESALQAVGKTYGLGKSDVKLVSAYASMYGVAQVRAGKWFQTSYNRSGSMGAAATRLALLKLAGTPVPKNLTFLVQDRDFDTVPNQLTQKVLQQHPEVTGQWDV
jgi:ribose transport system substrate-binding protein